MARRPTAKKNPVVDFTGVEGKRDLVAEGDHASKVVEITTEEGDAGQYFKWKFEITEGESEGGVVYYNTSLAPKALWNLRNLLETLGVEVPSGPLEIDFADLVDLEIGLTIVHEDYKGKDQAKVADFYVLETGEVKPGPDQPKATAKAKPGAKASALPKLKADNVSEMDESELESVVEKYTLKIDLDEHKSLRKKANAVLDALEAKEMLEE